MSTYITRITEKTEVAKKTIAFWLERPQGFEFIAGQSITLIDKNPSAGGRKDSRTFSIASSPLIAGRLMVVTRMTGSAFKTKMANSSSSIEWELLGPSGNFSMHHNAIQTAVFIAGGIGITPLRSMLFDALDRKLANPITLIYSNRGPESAAFHSELQYISKNYNWFNYIPTLTGSDKAAIIWDGHSGKIDKLFLNDHLSNFHLPAFYIAGSPGFVFDIKQALLDLETPAQNIHVDEFFGY